MKFEEFKEIVESKFFDEIEMIDQYGNTLMVSCEDVDWALSRHHSKTEGTLDFGDEYHVNNSILIRNIVKAEILDDDMGGAYLQITVGLNANIQK